MKKNFLVVSAILFAALIVSPGSVMAQSGDELITAVAYQDMDEVIKLVEAGVDINFKDQNYGSTALIMACQTNLVDIGKYLIEHGADIHLRAESGHTPLMAAASRSEELFNLLLEKGADVSAELENGITAFTIVVTGILADNMGFEAADKLLAKGANVDESTKSGRRAGYTRLMSAARNGRPDIVKYLVEKGADVNAKAGDGNTPLSLAEEKGDQEMVALLKSLGAK